MAHLVSEDHERLRRGHLAHGGVPNDDPLGCAETGDIGVERRGFVAGFHLEHAVGRDVHSSAMHDAFDLGDEFGMMIAERLEFVEHRLDPNRLDEHHEDNDGDQRQPEVKPPAARAAADHGVENPAEKSGEDDAEQQALGPILKPPAPMLDREAVLQADVVSIDVKWKIGQLHDRTNRDITMTACRKRRRETCSARRCRRGAKWKRNIIQRTNSPQIVVAK